LMFEGLLFQLACVAIQHRDRLSERADRILVCCCRYPDRGLAVLSGDWIGFRREAVRILRRRPRGVQPGL